MKCKLRLLSALFFAAAFLAVPHEVHADVAPPINPPGTNVEPGGESTQVRMTAEKVVLEVLDDGKEQGLGRAHVAADFTMTNLGGAAETMQVRFPISANDGRGQYPQISGVVVKVEGKIVPTSLASYSEDKYTSEPIPWVEFAVTFPPGKDVAISVAYDLQGSGYYPYTAFYYLLETGAGWKGTIGRAEIVLRLPYAANSMNVVQDFPIGWAETNRGGSFSGREVRWLYEDFEPGPYAVVQNMEFALMAPGAWKKVLIAQDAVKTNPKDGEAWGRLAKTYKELFYLGKGYRSDAGGSELFRLSVEAYEQCLELKPSDAQWHAGYADLLANRAYWDSWSSSPTHAAFQALEEIRTALQLAPNDPTVQEIALDIHWMFPEGMTQISTGYDFPWLTQTPTPHPPTATIAPVFDPNLLSGEYTSPWLTLWDGQQAKLRLSLKADYSAALETTFQGQADARSEQGVWQDNGDGSLTVSLAWPNGDPYRIVFHLESGQLTAIEYPSYFGDGGMRLENPRQVQAAFTQTVPPSATLTLAPTRQAGPGVSATIQPVQSITPTLQPIRTTENPQPGAKSGLPCASISLAPLALVGYWWWSKRRAL